MSDYPSDWGGQAPQDFPPRNQPPAPAGPPPGPPPGFPPSSYPPPAAPPPAPPGPAAPEPGYPDPGYPDPYGRPGYPAPGPAAPQPSNYPPPNYGPPPQAPAPSGPYPPPAKVRSRPRIWPWLLGFLTLFMLLIGGCSYWVYSLAKGPLDAVNVYVAALDEGRYQDAYNGLCASTRQTVSQADFEADNAAAPRITGYTFASVAAETGQLTQVAGTVDIDGAPVTATFFLHRESGDWKICEYFPLQ